MGRYIIRRLIWVGFVLLLVTLLTYAIFFLLPPGGAEGIAARFAGKVHTQDAINEIKVQFGLNHPWWYQYALFVKHIFGGDKYGWPGLGFSFNTRSALKPIIIQRMIITLQLAVGAAVVWLIIGIPIGILSALRPRSVGDRFAMGFALFGVSAPVFWLGLMFLYIFWFKLHIAAPSGYVSIGQGGFFTWLNQMIMPWVVLALLYAAFYARMSRGNLIETMTEDYIRTARAKGLSEARVVVKHGLRASLTPVVTMFGMDLGALLGGAIITETVFNLQGLGRLAVTSVFSSDLYAVVDVTILAAFFVVFSNLIVDIVYAYLDPRVRYT
jgi:peptide/nickel transport system permease protein